MVLLGFVGTTNRLLIELPWWTHIINDLLTSLSGGKVFSKLDLAHAYQQIPLDEESKDLTAINTEKGLFCYNRLPFGISAAPAIFQRTMEGILQGLPQVCVYMDDILVTGATEAEHLKNLEAVLTRVEEAGFKLKKEKCAFLLNLLTIWDIQLRLRGWSLMVRRLRQW